MPPIKKSIAGIPKFPNPEIVRNIIISPVKMSLSNGTNPIPEEKTRLSNAKKFKIPPIRDIILPPFFPFKPKIGPTTDTIKHTIKANKKNGVVIIYIKTLKIQSPPTTVNTKPVFFGFGVYSLSFSEIKISLIYKMLSST